MPSTRQRVVAFCLLLIMTAGASAAPAVKTAKKPVAAGNATFYIYRTTGMIPNPFKPDIKIDGRTVAELSDGTYIVVTRPAGRHTIEVQPGGLTGGYTSEVSAAPGQSYFIAIAPLRQGAPGSDALAALFYGNAGATPMPGRSGFYAMYGLFSLDPQQGRAAIAKLKRVRAH